MFDHKRDREKISGKRQLYKKISKMNELIKTKLKE